MRILNFAIRAAVLCTVLSAQVPIDVDRLMQRGNHVGWVYGTAAEAGQAYYT
jgi:hypothetical protein